MMKSKRPDCSIEAKVRPVTFSIGCLTGQEDPGESYQVAILLGEQGKDAKMDAVMMDDWGEVLAVIQALLESATNAWGVPADAIELTQPTAH